MTYTKEDLIEAQRQIDSTLRKLHQVVLTLEAKPDPSRCRSQITLARRRIHAFGIAAELIGRELTHLSAEKESP